MSVAPGRGCCRETVTALWAGLGVREKSGAGAVVATALKEESVRGPTHWL